MLLLLLCSATRFAAYVWNAQRRSTNGESPRYTELFEGIFLSIAALLNGLLNAALSRRDRREVAERVRYAVKVLYKASSPTSPKESRKDAKLSPSSCYVACYRDSQWQSMPMNLLVDGDVIALMSGDVVPGQVRLLYPTSPTPILYTRGQKVDAFSSTNCVTESPRIDATFQPDVILHLCGDMHVFVMEETPVLQDIFNSIFNVARPSTALQTLQDAGHVCARYTCVIFALILLGCIVVRAWVLPEPLHHAVNHLCLGPVGLLLCFVSLHAPFVWFLGEAAATGHLLTAFEAILAAEQTTSFQAPLDEDDMDVYDVEEREQFRSSKLQKAFTVERSWYYFWSTLQFRCMDCTDAHRTRYHNGKKSKLTIPYSGLRLLERLGSTTMLCCFDDDILCEDAPCVEEIFLLNDEATNSTVLDLHPEASCVTGLKFEDPKWRLHLPSLKPLGLAILLNDCEDPKTEYLTTLRHLSTLPTGVDVQLSHQADIQQCLLQLSGHVRLLPYPRHLLNLAREIGFQPADLDKFQRRRSVHVIAPRLAIEEHTMDHHAQGQEDTRYRGYLKTHLYSNVVLDKRSHGHQLLSRGHPSLVVSQCGEYWDGKSICPLSSEKRRLILDMYNQWRVEDLDCVALTYAPVAQKFNPLFASSASTLPSVFLVEDHAAGELTMDPKQPCTSTSSPARAHATEPRFAGAHTSPSTPQQRYPVHWNNDGASSTGHAGGDDLWKLQEDQIFLGMVASGVQPRKGIVDLIEDLTASGVRFVYFSPRNMRRSKLLAEKMGIETDWNCAISLRDSEGPDPHRMTSNYSDWDVKARLPHGTAAIRRHLETVDNVPLLVSLYTDSTPETIEEMIGIFQENHEVVLGVGTSLRESNVSLFSKADLAVAFEGNPKTLFGDELPKGPFLPVFSDADMELSQILNTLTCCFTVRDFGLSRASPVVLIELIRLGRLLLTNFTQLVTYIFVMQLFVATVLVLAYLAPFPEVAQLSVMSILWLLWLLVPTLSLCMLSSPPHRALMSRTPPKNEPLDWSEVPVSRICVYFGLRYVPSALFVLVLFQCVFGLSLHMTAMRRGDPNALSSAWWDHAWHDEALFTHPRPPAINAALDRAEGMMLFGIGVFAIVTSSGHLYRSDSLFAESPLRNRPWLVASCVLLLLQMAISVLRMGRVGVDGVDLDEFLRHVPWYCWAALGVWPLVVVCMDELVKAHDHKLVVRYYKFMRMQFDTRLGMWSPR
ncbi:hypothetical protein SPRG_14636 [Saprolegnia parasitica CBS 223.65]|uniref:Cation-transporting P-type ATPase C-terminal domain-containing protein n=1 Tax=Saprolegnia parasitica (strain CBS 223.65) TaxID=695850 RepID=A0A067BZW0_SAPPC|nr:hypothetical protein SPRG_14636 [Saprolegnia parasitica CBS 223.65]KDO20097.1 hypothetical protein SPRG_14636 [Saprolegnia parasitica CBS 223.65]|eukprot:XP_012209200.1 hypothetical protein SPRG_14636 [Saprolegnia parasitica CBS 223.65]